MEAVRKDPVEYGIARFLRPGQNESGDEYLICSKEDRVLLAVIDGIGHGPEAAHAAKTAVHVLEQHIGQNMSRLIELCHLELRATRGAVLSMAVLDFSRRVMTWLGVGNVQGVLFRGHGEIGSVSETLLLRPGVVGSRLPVLQPEVVRVCRGDILFLATDGIRPEFREHLNSNESPQAAASRLLSQFGRKDDDALLLVSRFVGMAV